LTLPCEFSFEAGCNDVKSIAVFNIFIHPCILPAEFSGRRQNQSTLAPSLVAPSAAKKKITSKRVLIQVKIFSFLSIKPLFILIIFILCNFRPELSNH
jgi:hypothetical protein